MIIWSLQLFNIFVRERVSAFVKFYEENKSFVDDLGKCRVSVHFLIFFFCGGGVQQHEFVCVCLINKKVYFPERNQGL